MTTVTNTPRADAITEGVSSHVRKMRDIIKDFGEELAAMQKLEAALRAAVDRLDRGANLVHLETQMVEQLIRREKAKPASVVPLQSTPLSNIIDKVEADLEMLMIDKPVGTDGNGNPVSISVPVAKR